MTQTCSASSTAQTDTVSTDSRSTQTDLQKLELSNVTSGQGVILFIRLWLVFDIEHWFNIYVCYLLYFCYFFNALDNTVLLT